jgi:hypothetical protein
MKDKAKRSRGPVDAACSGLGKQKGSCRGAGSDSGGPVVPGAGGGLAGGSAQRPEVLGRVQGNPAAPHLVIPAPPPTAATPRTTPSLKTQTQQLLPLVAPRWHKEFLRFIATGEASHGFFTYLDSDENCQKAVDKAIDAQARIFQKLAETLRSHT